MIYVMSALKGDFEGYRAMLSKIHLRMCDTLFLMGDILGGSGGFDILWDAMYRPNVIPIMGDREYLFCERREGCPCVCERERREVKRLLSLFCALSPDKRSDIEDYLSEFLIYAELPLWGRSYLMVHGGICGRCEEGKGADSYLPCEIVFPSHLPLDNSEAEYVISAHRPQSYPKSSEILVSPKPKGANIYLATSSRVACLRLDDFREYYI